MCDQITLANPVSSFNDAAAAAGAGAILSLVNYFSFTSLLSRDCGDLDPACPTSGLLAVFQWLSSILQLPLGSSIKRIQTILPVPRTEILTKFARLLELFRKKS